MLGGGNAFEARRSHADNDYRVIGHVKRAARSPKDRRDTGRPRSDS